MLVFGIALGALVVGSGIVYALDNVAKKESWK